jgi:hypothetical protein
MWRAFMTGTLIAAGSTLIAVLFKLDVGTCMVAVTPISAYLGWRRADDIKR